MTSNATQPAPAGPAPASSDDNNNTTAADDGSRPPASPPLPARHTAATPGPRAQRLADLYESSLSHALAKVAAWDSFAACYPTAAQNAPGALKAVQRAMVARLGELCRREFDSVVAARGVVPRLNELEGLVAEAARRREAGEKGLA
jgi:kinetochore protein NNF1